MISIRSTGTARIRHNISGEIFEIEAEQLDWEIMGSEERQMGPENSYTAVIEHPELGQLSWSLWEYPVGMENDTETDVGPHELLENIRFRLQHLPDGEEREDYESSPLPLPMRLAALPQQLDELDRALTRLREFNPMFGHNRPPEEFRLGLQSDEIDAARQGIADVRIELAKPNAITNADVETLVKGETLLQRLGSKIAAAIKWIGKYGSAGVITGIGKELWEDPIALHKKLLLIADTLAAWANYIIQLL